MKIYTKKGDTGTTQLIGGTRVPKHHLRIEAYGTIDELNSWMGMVHDAFPQPDIAPVIRGIQNNLFAIGAQLAADPGASNMQLPHVTEADVTALEASIDALDSEVPPLRNFVLPGGHAANSTAHVARCVCRRAERLAAHLAAEEGPIPGAVLPFLNRLSDWLFLLARVASHRLGAQELAWKA